MKCEPSDFCFYKNNSCKPLGSSSQRAHNKRCAVEVMLCIHNTPIALCTLRGTLRKLSGGRSSLAQNYYFFKMKNI